MDTFIIGTLVVGLLLMILLLIGRSSKTVKQEIVTLSEIVNSISEGLDEETRITIQYPLNEPLSIEDQLTSIAYRVYYYGFTCDTDDEELDMVIVSLESIFRVRIRKVGVQKVTKKVICAIEGSMGEKRVEQLNYQYKYSPEVKKQTQTTRRVGIGEQYENYGGYRDFGASVPGSRDNHAFRNTRRNRG